MKKIYVAIVILVLLGLSLYLMEGDVNDDEKGNKKSDEKGNKKSDEKGNKKSDEKGNKKDYKKCVDIEDKLNGTFDECVKCDRDDGVLLLQCCNRSQDPSLKNCLHIKDNIPENPNINTGLDFKHAYCSSNINATYDECKSVNYEDVFCYNNPNKKGEDVKKCKDYLINSDYCTGNNMANYKDCCSSATGNILNDYINDYKNKTPTPFDTPKIKISLPTKDRGTGGITKSACTLRENCKNIVVTPDNVYPVRRLCSDITIGYGTNYDKDSKKYDFSDSICKKIKQLVEDRFNNVHLTYPKKDDQEDGFVGKIDEDGVYTFNDNLGNKHIYNYHSDYYTYNEPIKKKIKQNGYENLIREYCHCWNNDPKPEICKLLKV
jgi:hypothetical protein